MEKKQEDGYKWQHMFKTGHDMRKTFSAQFNYFNPIPGGG